MSASYSSLRYSRFIRPIVVALLLLAATLTGLVFATEPAANQSPQRHQSPEVIELLKIQTDNANLLKELSGQYSATTDTVVAENIAARIMAAKKSLEIRTLETRLKYARNEGRQEQAAQLQKTLAVLKSAHSQTTDTESHDNTDSNGKG